MTFKDITMLALLLIVGLSFNHCAFKGDVFDAREAKHVERIVSDMEVSMEEFGEQMGEFGERMGEFGAQMGEASGEFGEQMGEFGESVGESFVDFGDKSEEDITIHSDDDNGANRKSETVELSITSELADPIEIDLALDVPAICDETTLDFGRARKSTLGIGASHPIFHQLTARLLRSRFTGKRQARLRWNFPGTSPT